MLTMNDQLKVGLEVEVGDSSPVEANANNTPKRQSEESTPTPKKKKNKVLQGMKAADLLKMLQENPIKFCQDLGLMAKTVKCACGEDMMLVNCNISKDLRRWRCRKKGKSYNLSVRKGTWFENTPSTPGEVLYVVYMWLHEYSLKAMLHESSLTEKVIREWCGSCLDLCQAILEHKRDPLGGEQKTVEIFQCSFRRPNEKEDQWVFCGLEQNSTKSVLIYLEEEASTSMSQIFGKYFLPGTKVVGRVWTLWEDVTESDFRSLIGEKSLTFFDLVTKVKMDTYKEFLKKTRQRPGLCKLVYDDGFFEKMYRKSLDFAPDAYLAFLKDVSEIYKPCEIYKPGVTRTNASKAVED